MMTKRFFQILILLTFSNSIAAFAQLIEYPIPRNQSKTKQTTQRTQKNNARGSDLPAIPLPFWDDFTAPINGNLPNPNYWESNTGALIENGIGLNAPSYNVLTFDGANLSGNVYSTTVNTIALADIITSRCIDLSQVPNENAVYLSFYWQLKGLGEIPDQDDRIFLEFKDADDNWETVWEESGDVSSTETTTFKQKIIKVEKKYQFDHFQFRFSNENKLDGAFDTWNIDYIYLDKNRNVTDLTFQDRAFSNFPTGTFGPFTGIPFEQFKSQELDLNSVATATEIEIQNLANNLSTSNFTAFLSSIKSPNNALLTLNSNTSFGPVLKGLERRTLSINEVDVNALKSLVTSADTLLHTVYFDKVDLGIVEDPNNGAPIYYPSVDLTQNDTIRKQYAISDYFAYDDGSAEFGAGINQLGGKLVVAYDIPLEDNMTAIDIYFPGINLDLQSVPIDILVLKDLEDNEDSELYSKSVTINPPTIKNDFFRFEFDQNVPVQGTVYIGHTLITNVHLALGLDKNTNNAAKIFYNTNGKWEVNTNVVGTLMIRPVFGESKEITTINSSKNKDVPWSFPNPASNSLNFIQEVIAYKLLDLNGKLLVENTFQNKNNRQINTSLFEEGLYILKVKTNKGWQTKPLIINR